MGLEINNGRVKIPGKIIGILIGLAGLGFGYWAHSEKAAILETEIRQKTTEIETLKETERNLQDLYNNRQKYEKETIELNKKAEVILEDFPTFMYLEDKELYSMYLTTTGQNAIFENEGPLLQFGVVDGTRYGDSKFIMSTSYSDTSLMELYSVDCAGEFQDTTYIKVKELINYGRRPIDELLEKIEGAGETEGQEQEQVGTQPEEAPYKYPERFVLSKITISLNPETGLLSGEYSYSTYFITGQKTPYTFNEKVEIYIGEERRIDDLFGSLNIDNSSDGDTDDTFDTNGFFDSTDITDILDEVDDSLDG